jgi:16S rRNA (guanine1207-N2)-methyltransferase
MDKDPAMLALAHLFEDGTLSLPRTARCGVLFAQEPLPNILPYGCDLYTPWKADSDRFARNGYACLNDTDALDHDYDLMMVRVPHQRDCALATLAQGWAALKPGGILIAAAANDAGGRRLQGDLLPHIKSLQSAAKHKCRIVWANKSAETLPAYWIENALWQRQHGTGLWTRPGLFSWDRVDMGTSLLLRHLPDGLTGSVADFGCGIGIIAHHLLSRNPGITTLTALDADRRAVVATQRNLAMLDHNAAVTVLWADMTATLSLPRQDCIVMNPPFHKDKIETIALGQAFLLQARSCLKPGGQLWLVSNTHLPYEIIMAEVFCEQTLIARENGFKIIRACA